MKDIKSNGFHDIIAQAIEEMKSEQGENFSLNQINLAELQRRTGISRAKLRRLKQNGFTEVPHALQGRKSRQTILTATQPFWMICFAEGLPILRCAWSGCRP